MTFEDLQLNKNILRAIDELGYKEPTPIQQKAIPFILAEKDLIGCAQTGTGKTAAFAMPIIHYLHKLGNTKKAKKAKVLIVTPTRELAVQIGDNFEKYAKYTNVTYITLYGGMSIKPQIEQLNKGADVIIGTPGRLLDLYKQKHLDLDHLHFLVLDEADLMLDMGFIDDVKKLIQLTPSNRQTLLFSATMPLPIRELAHEFLQKPEYVTVDPISSTAQSVKHKVFFVEKGDKKKLLYHIIRNEKLSDVLVFTRTKAGADNVVESLKKNNVNAEAFHGDMSQTARQAALDSFKNKETKVLVATDIAARGIDIDNLPVVINYDLPNIPETFVHRIGRTGRAGNDGLALSFCDKSEKTYWEAICKFGRLQPKIITDHPFPWKEVTTKDGQAPKKDYRKKPGQSNSRKSENSKKNKKRWY
ncbi:DEAD/DEAH box helicase [Myroides marinus]|jgi:ATP-dependent RNA helicase RhlE|uniref:DEAD-box ATP-dependent RNA helicase RhpA n=1 Tax=Myroides marinus TaxID=703342 RepID=A0A161S9N0_9FLAO|nr:DEAD/DEAH box helicase [Myroides marinus]MDR0195273.1 DEAD/DEAH box helicase [Myroides sp.]KUF39321.1 RNA helicase [Myroides marinus]KZE76515.1 RNA helicase [Myroides marinus]MDM1345758.1 DEAD/DEAH box helicase [Myroides marinus]MDM1349381.1 DEAD/DEAH box helicase [Myroides marinus]